MAEMTPARKRIAVAFVAIGIALIVQRTVASAGDGGDGGETAVVAPASRPSHADATAGAQASPTMAPPRLAGVDPRDAALRIDRLQAHRQAAASAPDNGPVLFAMQSWQPPAPAPAPSAAPPPPVAPPFPYAYMGSLADDAGRTAFFNRGDRVLAVRAGDLVDGTFRVDHLDETSMTLTYVPLDKPLRVALGGLR